MDAARSVVGYVAGPGLIPQILLTIVVMLTLFAVITLVETVVETVKKYERQTTVLFKDTTTSGQVVVQKPNYGTPMIYNSENEMNGMEFSYSMHLFISPETFEGRSGGGTCGGGPTGTAFKHIFHKGSKDGFPLLAPGLFVDGKVNTLRLYMNSSTRWDNYVEIPNVPIGKWFHLIVVLKGKYLDAYVNGNVTVRHQFAVVPKLNFGNIYVMSQIQLPSNRQGAPKDIGIKVNGPMKGMVSRLKYYAYALNYSQIDELYREGPSKKIVSNSFGETPPYFRDDWWVTRY
jgi:hypothetical protein